jgi:hypothetical protein
LQGAGSILARWRREVIAEPEQSVECAASLGLLANSSRARAASHRVWNWADRAGFRDSRRDCCYRVEAELQNLSDGGRTVPTPRIQPLAPGN